MNYYWHGHLLSMTSQIIDIRTSRNGPAILKFSVTAHAITLYVSQAAPIRPVLVDDVPADADLWL